MDCKLEKKYSSESTKDNKLKTIKLDSKKPKGLYSHKNFWFYDYCINLSHFSGLIPV